MTDSMRLALHADLSTSWAIREDALSVVARAALGKLTSEDLARATQLDAGPTAQAPIEGSVAVIPLRGLITARPSIMSLLFGGGAGLQGFRSMLREAVASDDISSILINVDSPGGSTDLVAETAAEIRDARGKKPIVAVANTMAASAAYWIASQADELVVTPSGEIGSIGVFSVHEEYSKMDENLGITTTVVRAGKFKAETNPYEPLTDEARAAMQETVDEFYGLFVADVAKGRAVTPKTVRDTFGEGRMVTAKKSVGLGMADRVATFEDEASRLAGGRRARKANRGADVASHTPTQAHEVRGLRLARPRHL